MKYCYIGLLSLAAFLALGLTIISFEEYIEDADFIAHGQVKFNRAHVIKITSNGNFRDMELNQGLFDYHGHNPNYSRHKYKGGPKGGFNVFAEKRLIEEYEALGMGVWKLTWNSFFNAYEISPAPIDSYPELKEFAVQAEEWRKEAK